MITPLLAGASVPDLFSLRCPPAISGRVVPVVVNPVNAEFWRRLAPHVGQEVFERAAPPSADADAAATVTVISFGGWVRTSRPHIAPDGVFWRGVLARRIPVSEVALPAHLPLKATATSAFPGSQITRGQDATYSAGALAKPIQPSGIGSGGFAQNDPPAKLFPGKVPAIGRRPMFQAAATRGAAAAELVGGNLGLFPAVTAASPPSPSVAGLHVPKHHKPPESLPSKVHVLRFVLQASASFDFTALEIAAAYNASASAVATAVPHGGFARAARARHNAQLSEPSPSQVLKVVGASGRILRSHRLLRSEALGQWRSAVPAAGRHVSLYTPHADKSSEKRKAA